MNGGRKDDRVDYFFSPSAVVVDLATGVATGHGTDTLVSIQDVSGSEFGDTLRGNAEDNYFNAGTGDDDIFGKRGDDFLFGEADIDEALGGPGSDYCDAEAVSRCEAP